MSWIPSRATGSDDISMMIFSACRTKVGVFPTDIVGIRCPFSVMQIASTTATSAFPQPPSRTCSDNRERWSSLNRISPELILSRITLLLMYGRRQPTNPALASTPSTASPVEAPAKRLILNGPSFSARRINACGISLGYPAVKPEINRLSPSLIKRQAVSGSVTLSRSGLNRIRSFNDNCGESMLRPLVRIRDSECPPDVVSQLGRYSPADISSLSCIDDAPFCLLCAEAHSRPSPPRRRPLRWGVFADEGSRAELRRPSHQGVCNASLPFTEQLLPT